VFHRLSFDKPHFIKKSSARPKHSSYAHIYLTKSIEFWTDEERNKSSSQDLFFVFNPWSLEDKNQDENTLCPKEHWFV
jgi:hypothetical protein